MVLDNCGHFGIDVGRKTLLGDFDQIANKTRLTNKTTLAKILSARKELKHHLTLPALSAIAELRYSTKIFLVENTTNLFAVDFESISLKDMIQDDVIRNHIASAFTMKEKGDYITAMYEIRFAYDRLVDLFGLNLRPGWSHDCDVDSLELFYFYHLIPPNYKEQQFAAFDEACDFCLEFILDAAIKIEQQMSSSKIIELGRLLRRFHELMKRS